MSRVNTMLHLLLLWCLISTAKSQSQSPYKPTDMIFLDCGAKDDSTQPDGKKWQRETGSTFIASNSDQTHQSISDTQDPSVPSVPYMTARIIRANFTYKFPVSAGPKFLRLHFYPSIYSGSDTSSSFFTVTTNGYTLLSNFSANLTVSVMQQKTSYFVKEFIVTVSDQQQSLDVAFAALPNSFAFINGIEIVSIPDHLFYGGMDQVNSSKFVGYGSNFPVENSTSLETLYRLDVGGGVVTENDTGMYRKWEDDTDYIFGAYQWMVSRNMSGTINYTEETPAYVAPKAVYETMRSMGNNAHINSNNNLTWLFSVDSGFYYLLRLHFCERLPYMNSVGARMFIIFINNMTAESEADVILWAGHINTPVYRDYVVLVPPEKESKQDIWLQLHPSPISDLYIDAFLNGLEIFKLNNTEGSLAVPNPELVIPEQPLKPHDRNRAKNSFLVVAVVVPAIAVVIAFFLIIYLSAYRRTTKVVKYNEIDDSSMPISSGTSSLPTEICHRFSIAEIRAATGGFNEENVLGSGGFGKVYKGYIKNGSVVVAVKRLELSSRQGVHEFHTEIRMLSHLRHVHLVSLTGYCCDQDEMILVYEFMPEGTLRDHLYGTRSPLSWKQRIQICTGAARGLQYLHEGTKSCIIHRDVKPTNILLDDNMVAKVSDFGLSKIGPTGESNAHVTTVVKGSFGYLDPEYFRRNQLTIKSDVYSFGVVLLEVLCARPPLNSRLAAEQVSLVEWASKCLQEGTIDKIIDPYLKGNIVSVSLNKFVEVAMSCVKKRRIERPRMSDVVGGLEFALMLQETAEHNADDGGDTISNDNKTSPAVRSHEVIEGNSVDKLFTSSEESTTVSRSTVSAGGEISAPKDFSGVLPEDVFSEITNQREGR